MTFLLSLEEGEVVDGAPHGMLKGYKSFGCRCFRCRQANREYVREYRKSQGVVPMDLVAARKQVSYWKREANEARERADLWKRRYHMLALASGLDLRKTGARGA